MSTDIILASGSLIRSKLLQDSGVVFHVKKHKIDEEEKTIIQSQICSALKMKAFVLFYY